MAEWVANLGFWWYVIFYLAIQIVNVILNTLKTIITARATKMPAAVINALTFGFYTLVLALTADISNLWVNMVITIVANLIGVYISIAVLDKLRKDKLWEITATVKTIENTIWLKQQLLENNISYSVHDAFGKSDNVQVFHIYSSTQKESIIVKELLKKTCAKYIVHEENAKL
jgi:uncharacterized protein YebE (UPF0316 family)